MDLTTAFKNTTVIFPRLPREELEYIRAHKEKALPRLLSRLQLAAEDDYAGDVEYVLFPLAEFRENRAMPHLLEILRFDDPHYLDLLLGDTLTEGYDSVIASCATKEDIPSIKSVVLDNTLYEFARAAALSALNIMYAEGAIIRDDMVAFYKELFENCSDYDSFMELVVTNCAELHFDEFMDQINSLYDSGRFDRNETWEGWQEYLSETTRENAHEKFRENRWGSYIHDMIAAISWWAVFKDGYDYDFGRKIGRNELCPCGSGLKFKKCCLR